MGGQPTVTCHSSVWKVRSESKREREREASVSQVQVTRWTEERETERGAPVLVAAAVRDACLADRR